MFRPRRASIDGSPQARVIRSESGQRVSQTPPCAASSTRQTSLLFGSMKRELAVADTRRQSLGELRGGVLAIGFH
jgi:hypothetical protein